MSDLQIHDSAATAVEVKVETVPDPSRVQDTPMASAPKKICGMCGGDGKYKCSRCEMPYCSVTCATAHRSQNCEKPTQAAASVVAEPEVKVNTAARPGTAAATNTGNIFSVLEHSQKLQQLFVMYPDLRKRLRDIYNATLSPTEPGSTYGSAGSSHQFQYGRESKVLPWNQDRGTQEGIDALSTSKLEYGRGGEAVREFSNLVLKLVTADGVDVAQLVHDEISGENAKLIHLMNNGGAY